MEIVNNIVYVLEKKFGESKLYRKKSVIEDLGLYLKRFSLCSL